MTVRPRSNRPAWAFLGLCLLGSGCTAKQVQYQPLTTLPSDPGPRTASLFLVGDAGEINDAQDAVMAHLREEIEDAAADGTPTVVAYLGDNIYEVGAREGHTDEDRLKLLAQIQPLGARGNVRGVFIPGNHDWAKGASSDVARNSVRLQRELLAEFARDRDVALLPDDECPGPATMDLPGSVHLVFIDTEWLLREPVDRCGSADDFYERLTADLADHRNGRVVVMAHHPLATGGPHGGHVAPLRLGPGILYLATKAGVSVQDLASGDYSRMKRRLESAFERSGSRPLVFAAGHDHNLQVIRQDAQGQYAYQLVSGSGARTSNARRIDGTRYATNGNGYMRMDFGRSGTRLVVFARADGSGSVRPVFSCVMSSDASEEECPEAPLVPGGS